MYHIEYYHVGLSFYNKHELLKITNVKPGPWQGVRKRRKGERRQGMKVKYRCMHINLKSFVEKKE